jgi:hypothetical protein
MHNVREVDQTLLLGCHCSLADLQRSTQLLVQEAQREHSRLVSSIAMFWGCIA